ncbi:putative phospholipid-transporting atpase [Anaeramoeba flamelloides]|uniref:Phospholipid-transporting ATPase n=1 Tax=Anaeramoeba flamelloides TaxID=1746091 RepID=A0AAV8AC22_9EUKA|nr:putative phospholipid-transporting atpase [Anaeramoeba flamelloides]
MQQDSESRSIKVNYKIGEEEEEIFASNVILTSRYTTVNFLPKNLFEQFRRLANFYFLLVIILEYFPFSPLSGTVSLLPLVFVLTVTAVREAFEDWQRHKSDRNINNAESLVYDNGQFVTRKWKDIVVGDIVKVHNKEFFPTDLVVLTSSEKEGICYIDTCNLDGETNLKIKQGIKATYPLQEEKDFDGLDMTINCELPNNRLYNFDGNMVWNDQKESLSNKQILLRGCMLKNTQWVIGICVFTGKETKLMMNQTDPPSKRSTIEVQLNPRLLTIFAFLAIIGLVGGIAAGVWQTKWGTKAWYLGKVMDDSIFTNGAFLGFTGFFSFIIVCNVMIPISLYVSMEVVKLIQSLFINWDEKMYHVETKTPAHARTSNLTEELGIIDYVFSDKTGTLTCNVMEFMKCTIGGYSYGTGVTEVAMAAAKRNGQILEDPRKKYKKKKKKYNSEKYSKKKKKTTTNIIDEGNVGIPLLDQPNTDDTSDEERKNKSSGNELGEEFNGEIPAFIDDHFLNHLNDKEHENSGYIHEFLLSMAVCHTVIPERNEEDQDNLKKIVYQAASPDEGALVDAARMLGYTFHTRTPDSVTISNNDEDYIYEILNVLEFNSTRKRMSVIVKTPQDEIKIFTKGADNVIYERLNKEQEKAFGETTLDHLEIFAKEGLRTLCFASRTIPQEEYDNWKKQFHEANTSLVDRKQKLMEVAELMERDLLLIGASAIEDKLQKGVPKAIEALMNAGIKVWVLTGDKKETAINIGFACSLITNSMYIQQIDSQSIEAMKEEIETCKEQMEEHYNKGGVVLVITGSALRYALMDEIRDEFLAIGIKCKAVVCCRVSPLQKSQVVDLVRKGVKKSVTLGIGDGANDVSMIQAAHVGIGISGQEGMQAVLASDYSIAQFKFLKRLLLVHGRWNFRRVCIIILYSFYKNMAFAFLQFIFAFQSSFTAQTLFDALCISFYNVIFTSFPIMVLSVFDQDVTSKAELDYPKLYSGGDRDKEFNFVRFWTWLLEGMYHALVLFLIPYFLWNSEPLAGNGQTSGLWGMSITVYTGLVFVVNLKLALHVNSWTWIHHFTIWGSIIVWFVFILILGEIPLLAPSMYKVAVNVFSTGIFWFTVFISVVICLVPDILIKYFRREFKPLDFHIIQEREKRNLGPIEPKKPEQIALKPSISIFKDAFKQKVQMLVNGKKYRHTGSAFNPGNSQGVVLSNLIVGTVDDDYELVTLNNTDNKINKDQNLSSTSETSSESDEL